MIGLQVWAHVSIKGMSSSKWLTAVATGIANDPHEVISFNMRYHMGRIFAGLSTFFTLMKHTTIGAQSLLDVGVHKTCK